MDSPDLQSVTPSVIDAVNSDVLTVSANASVAEVIAAMSNQTGKTGRHRTSYALVLRQRYPVGILTERDIVRLTATGADIAAMPIQRVMTSPVHTLKQSALQDIFAVLFLFRRYRIRHLPIVNDNDELVGMVTPNSIRQVLRPANLLKLRRVADVMSQDVVHAQRTIPVLELAQRMTLNRVSCIVIADVETEMNMAAMTPVGIVTERDIVQLQSMELDLKPLVAQDIMSTPLFLLNPQDSLWDAHQEMQRRHVRRLVVSWNWGKGLGIVTQTSLLKIFDPIEMYGIIESMQQTIHQINGGPSATVDRSQSSLADLLLDLEASLLQLSDVPAQRPVVDRALSTLQQMRERLKVQKMA